MRDPSITLYRDESKSWRWRLSVRTGRVLADSGQGYSRRIDAENAFVDALGLTGVQRLSPTYWQAWRSVSGPDGQQVGHESFDVRVQP